MKMIEIINLVMEYNEDLLKYIKGSLWLDDKKIPTDRKEKFYPKWLEFLEEMDYKLNYIKSFGISVSNKEALYGIEIQEKLKRKKVELFLEELYKVESFRKKHIKEVV
jgi:hypothetical protein